MTFQLSCLLLNAPPCSTLASHYVDVSELFAFLSEIVEKLVKVHHDLVCLLHSQISRDI